MRKEGEVRMGENKQQLAGSRGESVKV